MAVIHVINIHNHRIAFKGRKMKLPIGFDGYINDETGEIVETSSVETYATKDEIEKLNKNFSDDNKKKSKEDKEQFEKIEKEIELLKNQMPKFEFDKDKSSLNIVGE